MGFLCDSFGFHVTTSAVHTLEYSMKVALKFKSATANTD